MLVSGSYKIQKDYGTRNLVLCANNPNHQTVIW